MIRAIFLSTLFAFGCQTTKSPHQQVVEKRMTEHHQLVDQNTAHKIKYVGLQNAFQFSSTLMVPEVQNSEWKLKQTIYQWSDAELTSQQTNFLKKYGTDAQVFLSFYTPERKQNNLDKKTSKWQVYLWVGDQKYVGTVKKRKDLVDDIRAFFPDHNQWSKPYLVSFPVPPQNLDKKSAKLVITGPIGSGEVSFGN